LLLQQKSPQASRPGRDKFRPELQWARLQPLSDPSDWKL